MSTKSQCTPVAGVALLFAQIASACSWSYPIWAIRSKSADPLFRFTDGRRVGYIDASGKVVIPSVEGLDPASNFAGEFHEGLLVIRARHIRYVTPSGTDAFATAAEFAWDFSEGLAPARDKASLRWGYIDRRGEFAIAPRFDGAESFSEGLARVEVSHRYGYIDKSGNYAIPPRLSYGYDFHEGFASAIVSSSCGLQNGGSCDRPRFTNRFREPCQFTFIDSTGKPMPDAEFDDAKDFSEGLAPVKVGTKWGYVDKAGKLAVFPDFDSAEPFSDALARVELKGKAGYIDHSGLMVIPAQFATAESFSGGLALVGDQKRYWYINTSGLRAFDGDFPIASSFAHGLAHVLLDPPARDRSRTYAYIDRTGHRVFVYKTNPTRPR